MAVVAALVGVGVYFKMKAKKPPASAGGSQAQGGVTLSAPAQSTNAASASKIEIHLDLEKDLERAGGAPATKGPSQAAEEKAAAEAAKQAAAAKAAEGKTAAAAAKQAAAAKAAEEKAAAAAAKESATVEAAKKKASAEQAAVDELAIGQQVAVWLTERCGVNASDAKLYADALAQLGIDEPNDLQMVDGDDVPWPSVIKLVHRKKIQAAAASP